MMLAMKITVNGQEKELTDACKVTDLLKTMGLASAPCAVEVNKKLIRKPEHEATSLAEGDVVEIVSLVGGG